MFQKPSAAMMLALRDFVFRHEVFIEAREFDDGFIFTRLPRRGSKRAGPRRHFEVFLRRQERRVKFFSLTCGSEDEKRSQVAIDFPEKALQAAADAAIEYEDVDRSAKRYAAQFSKDSDTGRALFGYVRSESRLLSKLLGGGIYNELLRLVRRYRHVSERNRPKNKLGRQRRRSS
ncbi:MAG TPA: hypothetical protein VN628_09310 [Vicinamibacterales bacterium]|nr:hypothetical protein [Vicinamibacterales bacterium]